MRNIVEIVGTNNDRVCGTAVKIEKARVADWECQTVEMDGECAVVHGQKAAITWLREVAFATRIFKATEVMC